MAISGDLTSAHFYLLQGRDGSLGLVGWLAAQDAASHMLENQLYFGHLKVETLMESDFGEIAQRRAQSVGELRLLVL